MLNIGLNYKPEIQQSANTIVNKSVLHQLNYLKGKMKRGAATDMQSIFPEGFVFMNSLYALSWIDLIDGLASNDEIFSQGMKEVDWTIGQLFSSKGKSSFEKNLDLEYGAFYSGWTNFVLGKKLSIQKKENRADAEVDSFKKSCAAMSMVFKRSESPYIESYSNQAWPADVLLCIACLNLHDKIFEPKYESLIDAWLEKVKVRLDKNTGLIPHSVYFPQANTKEGAKGASQSLMLNFLVDIDKEFAMEQFHIYKELFVDYRFGLPGIRQFPKGIKGEKDIDSGPVILGIGGAASIVGQRTMAKFDEQELYIGLRNSIEAFGAGLNFNDKKRYLFGALPMADAFIAWSNSVEKEPIVCDKPWRRRFHFYSILIFALLTFVLYKTNNFGQKR